MNLQELFSIFPEVPLNMYSFVELSDICNDARKAKAFSVFVAIKGEKVDGHSFIPQAINNGAIAIVCENKDSVPGDFKGFVLQVPDSRKALDLLASRFYGDPGRQLICIGVTGTNGKTSTTYMIECILNSDQKPTGVIGTINHHLNLNGENKVWDSELTTPDPITLQKRLSEMKEHGAKAVAMEVSSHALEQKRVDSVPFDAVVFTNLTRDHLDFHRDMKSYFRAKERLFLDLLKETTKLPSFAIINMDDPWGRKIRVPDPSIIITYGRKDADLRYKILEMNYHSTKFEIISPTGSKQVSLPMPGLHNVQNALAALAVGFIAGVPLEKGIQALESFSGVPGRLQLVPNKKNKNIFVDYAHSPDALENVLKSLEKIRKLKKTKAKIWTVFGCGGDRDKGKRPLMGAIAAQFSDQVVVTSDNPRTEDPEAIIIDILAGITEDKKNKTLKLVDRKEAIHQAISMMADDDILLIAGKGHEDYQIIGKEKIYFSDYKVVQDFIG